MSTTLSDEELLRRMRDGDQEAFASLYRRRQGAIYRYALAMSGNASLAEEVTQEVFLALIRDNERYDPARGHLAAFLHGIARHHVLRCLERDRLYVPLEPAPENGDRPSESWVEPDAPGELARRETIEQVRRAVLALPHAYREAVVLCDLQQMSYEEAAGVLGCPVGTVRSRLHRGRALLAATLGSGRPESHYEKRAV